MMNLHHVVSLAKIILDSSTKLSNHKSLKFLGEHLGSKQHEKCLAAMGFGGTQTGNELQAKKTELEGTGE